MNEKPSSKYFPSYNYSSMILNNFIHVFIQQIFFKQLPCIMQWHY